MLIHRNSVAQRWTIDSYIDHRGIHGLATALTPTIAHEEGETNIASWPSNSASTAFRAIDAASAIARYEKSTARPVAGCTSSSAPSDRSDSTNDSRISSSVVTHGYRSDEIVKSVEGRRLNPSAVTSIACFAIPYGSSGVREWSSSRGM